MISLRHRALHRRPNNHLSNVTRTIKSRMHGHGHCMIALCRHCIIALGDSCYVTQKLHATQTSCTLDEQPNSSLLGWEIELNAYSGRGRRWTGLWEQRSWDGRRGRPGWRWNLVKIQVNSLSPTQHGTDALYVGSCLIINCLLCGCVVVW